MGILLIAALGVVDAHVGEHFQYGLFGGVPLQALMELHRLLNLCPDGLEGIEGGHGVLEDHSDLPAPDFQPVLVGAALRQVLTMIQDGTAVDRAVAIQQTHKGFDEHGFT